MSCSKQKPAAPPKVAKPVKPKYALIFFEKKREQCVVPTTMIVGEATVGEKRQVKWDGDLLECLIVLTGTNKGVLAKVDLDMYGRVVDKDKGPNSAESTAKRNIALGEKKLLEGRQQLSLAQVADEVASKPPLLISHAVNSPAEQFTSRPSSDSKSVERMAGDNSGEAQSQQHTDAHHPFLHKAQETPEHLPTFNDSSKKSIMELHPLSNQSQQGCSLGYNLTQNLGQSSNQPQTPNFLLSRYSNSFNSSHCQSAFQHNGANQNPNQFEKNPGWNYSVYQSGVDQMSDHSHSSYPSYYNYQQGHDGSNSSAVISTNEMSNHGTGGNHETTHSNSDSLTFLSEATEALEPSVPATFNPNSNDDNIESVSSEATEVPSEPSAHATINPAPNDDLKSVSSNATELPRPPTPATITPAPNDVVKSGADGPQCGVENPAVDYFRMVILPLATPEKLDFLKKITSTVEMALQHQSQPSTSVTPSTSGATTSKPTIYPADRSWNRVTGKHRVELVPLSGVWIDKKEKEAIVTRHKTLKPDPQEMLRHLLRETIGDENLISMNTAGKKGGHQALPSTIFETVKKFVKAQFPHSLDEHNKFTKTVNNYCGGLRRKDTGPLFTIKKPVEENTESPSKRVKVADAKPLGIKN